MTRHALERAQQRGVNLDAIREAISHPLADKGIRTDKNGSQSQQLISSYATVAINPVSGNVITVWPTHTKTRKKLSKEE